MECDGCMGDVIQFPRVKKEPAVDEATARLRRIQESLRKINELMERLKNDNPEQRTNPRRQLPPEHTD